VRFKAANSDSHTATNVYHMKEKCNSLTLFYGIIVRRGASGSSRGVVGKNGV
jgi:hypothetical protein